jgi:uncharacterized DUF497 family protein
MAMFEWDEAKRQANRAKHGVDFAAAADFEFGTALIWIDDRRDYGEVRYVAIGFIGPRLHVLTFTPRGETTRVISLRKANLREIERYVDS